MNHCTTDTSMLVGWFEVLLHDFIINMVFHKPLYLLHRTDVGLQTTVTLHRSEAGCIICVLRSNLDKQIKSLIVISSKSLLKMFKVLINLVTTYINFDCGVHHFIVLIEKIHMNYTDM